MKVFLSTSALHAFSNAQYLFICVVTYKWIVSIDFEKSITRNCLTALISGSLLQLSGKVRRYRKRTSTPTHAADGWQHESLESFRVQPVRRLRRLRTSKSAIIGFSSTSTFRVFSFTTATSGADGRCDGTGDVHQPHGSARHADTPCHAQRHGEFRRTTHLR